MDIELLRIISAEQVTHVSWGFSRGDYVGRENESRLWELVWWLDVLISQSGFEEECLLCDLGRCL